MTVKALVRALPALQGDKITSWLDAGQGAPVSRAAMVLEAVLSDAPRAEVPALVLADATLAQALGWDHLVQLLTTGLKRADMRKRGEDLHSACHRAFVSSSGDAVRLSTDLARRAAQLKVVAPKLRAKGAEAAVTVP
ncbi:hypothetical protein GCM10016455_29110 [Aliiroseovarius zhejiangensis]|uniref:Uncharacterized protein n=1 Tax=Aliiroseovarius zhejiangensis TaxID=1632025 RepID=A0ABQ3J9U2_9RHOB|nr:hypothetical protein GCM10016455_29110 [Aliiroseovarius zhejiangensis]